MPDFDDENLRHAMRDYVDAADRLDREAAGAAGSRELLDLSDRKRLAAMVLRRRLEQAGWLAPSPQRTTT